MVCNNFQFDLDMYMGEYYNLLIEYRDGTKQQWTVAQRVYFVKTLPLVYKLKNEIAVRNRLLKKEADIYSQMFMSPEMTRINGKRFYIKMYYAINHLTHIIEKRKWCPSCFFARDDIIVTEDLKIKGYKVVSFPDIFSKLHVMEALKAIARMHASSILYERKQEKSIQEQFKSSLFEVYVAPDNAFFNTGLRVINKLIDFN